MPSPPSARIIDFKLPLPWLITSAIIVGGFMLSLGWNSSAQSSKLDQLIVANIKLEKRLDDRDIRLDAMRDSIYAVQRVNDTNSLRITALESARK
jgi:outer membrane murein-binding lipoprotein Lpp